MKKLCSFLGVLSLTIVSSSTVIACNGGLDMSLSHTDQEKIVSIYNLTEDQLVKNGVRINSLMTDENIDKVVEAIGLTELINKSPNGAVLKKTLGVYIMSNQFLNEISSKVPGYEWIANKLSWQSQWAIKDLVKDENTSLALFNNVSGWMTKKDSNWSLSVTFLNEELLGWNGIEDPVYARVNINRKLKSNKDGEVQPKDSNEEAIHLGDDTSYIPNSQDSFLDEKNPNKGMIYQGYANSSSLFKLEKLLSKESSKLPTGFFNYSPSATDFINNTVINLDFANMVLQNSQKEIESILNQYLLDNPIFLSEGMSSTQVENIVKNQIYAVMLKNSIDRRNLIDSNGNPVFIKEQLIEADLIIKSMILKLEQNIKRITQENSWIDNQLLKKFANMIDTLQSENNEFVSVNKDEFFNSFRAIIEDSREKDNPESGQYAFFTGWLNANLYKTNEQGNLALVKFSDYLDFGYDSSYKFKVHYWSKVTPVDGSEKQWYSPDDSRAEDEYIADKGFRNVFLSQRLMNKAYNIETYNVLNKYQSLLPNESLELDIFGFDSTSSILNQANLEAIMLEKLKEAMELGSKNSDQAVAESWRIYHLAALINKYSNYKLHEVFEKAKNSDELEIHTKNVSLDFSKKSINLYTNFAKADDDIAFYELLKNKQINLITNDYKEWINSTIRENVFVQGIETLWNYSQTQYIFAGTVNTFGKSIDQDIENINKWWKSSKKSYNQFNYRIAISDKWKDLLIKYWEKNVSKNKKNPDYNQYL
ncbi:hypothetical protein [Spiroplasma endosymbiont of Atherix ibis]|uniref:hypothetical protein n=1 Tax=Spiroplasma endosymbiont of Atherix ibis TaxID=3066291 RepID=UPI0030D28495